MLVLDIVAFRHCWLCPAKNVLCSSQKRKAACCKLQARVLDDGNAQRDVLMLASSWTKYAVLLP